MGKKSGKRHDSMGVFSLKVPRRDRDGTSLIADSRRACDYVSASPVTSSVSGASSRGCIFFVRFVVVFRHCNPGQADQLLVVAQSNQRDALSVAPQPRDFGR